MSDVRQQSTDVNVNAVGWQDTADSTDFEYTTTCVLVTAAGDNIVYTPATGKSIRLHWVYTLNNPTSLTPALITVSLGGVTKFMTYGVSKRQQVTGPVNGTMNVNLSLAGSVACTFILEEV